MWSIWTFACEMLQSFRNQVVGVKRGYGHWQDDTEIFHEQDVWERDAGVRRLISLFGIMAHLSRQVRWLCVCKVEMLLWLSINANSLHVMFGQCQSLTVVAQLSSSLDP